MAQEVGWDDEHGDADVGDGMTESQGRRDDRLYDDLEGF